MLFRACVLALGSILGLTMTTEVIRPDTLTSTFPTTAIPDNDPAGVTLEVGTAAAAASVDEVTITLSHEWLGDLTLKLIPPSGPAITLFDRPGVTAATPDGSSALLGTFVFEGIQGVLVPQPYQFAATGTDFAAAAQNAVDTELAPAVPTDQIYAAQSWAKGPYAAGNWQIFVADSALYSTGLVVSAELSFTPVQTPEPGIPVLALISALTAGLCWRRQQNSKA